MKAWHNPVKYTIMDNGNKAQDFGNRLATVCNSRTLGWDIGNLVRAYGLRDRRELMGIAEEIVPTFPTYLQDNTHVTEDNANRFAQVFDLTIVHAPKDEKEYSDVIAKLAADFGVTSQRIDRMIRDSAKYFYKFLDKELKQRRGR